MSKSKFNKDGDEITRYGFISHMEAYIKQLLSDPINAKVDDYLLSHGIDSPIALNYLLEPLTPGDNNSAILMRKESIKTDKNSNKDFFTIKYKLPRDGYDKKMRNLYIKIFESYQTDNPLLLEDGEGGCSDCSDGTDGANGAANSGQFVQPLFGQIITRPIGADRKKDKEDNDIMMPDMQKECVNKIKTVVLSESQIELLKEQFAGDSSFQYDVPFSGVDDNDPTLDHKNMMAKSWPKKNKKNKPEN